VYLPELTAKMQTHPTHSGAALYRVRLQGRFPNNPPIICRMLPEVHVSAGTVHLRHTPHAISYCDIDGESPRRHLMRNQIPRVAHAVCDARKVAQERAEAALGEWLVGGHDVESLVAVLC
jgi:hypothetical protein